MLGLTHKPKSAPKEDRYVVVWHCPGAQPERATLAPRSRAEALQVFADFLSYGAEYFGPHQTGRLKVMSVDEVKRLTAAYALEAE